MTTDQQVLGQFTGQTKILFARNLAKVHIKGVGENIFEQIKDFHSSV
jgi:hypothetical protein